MFAWDIAGRLGQTDIRGFTTEVHEFDYRKEQVVYEENGVVIRAFPAIHAIDGSVSYSLEWNGLKIVFSSDSYPNKWFIEYARCITIAKVYSGHIAAVAEWLRDRPLSRIPRNYIKCSRKPTLQQRSCWALVGQLQTFAASLPCRDHEINLGGMLGIDPQYR